MTLPTPQTIMVAAFCGTGAYRGDWIARMTQNGKLSFLSTIRRDGESDAQAAVRCLKEQLWPDSPLEEHDFALAGLYADGDNVKIFQTNWLLPLTELDMTGLSFSSNRSPKASPASMTIQSLRALSKVPRLRKHMRGTHPKRRPHA